MSGFWRFFRYGLLTIAALVAILITMPFIWAGSAEVYQWLIRYTHHYRLVLEVEDHGEIRTGSSVIGVSFSPLAPWIHSEFGSSKTRIRGEAVVVELSTGQVVVATLRHGARGTAERMQYLASRTLGANAPGNLRDAPNWVGKGEVAASNIPAMILFRSGDDPSAGQWIRPDEFPEKIGPDIRFRRMTLEMTSDPVTRQIEEKLPFMTRGREEIEREALADGLGILVGPWLTR